MIPTYVLAPVDLRTSSLQRLQALEVIVELSNEGDDCSNGYLSAMKTARKAAYPFPSHDEADVIHGQGTVALELEEEVASLLKTDNSISGSQRGKLDTIINAMGNGSTLAGICMGLQGTGTNVFGVDAVLENVGQSGQPDFMPLGVGNQGWQDGWAKLNEPMGPLPWLIFTSPRMLSAVFYVGYGNAALARQGLFDQHSIDVDLNDAAPLAFALYSEDFRRHTQRRGAKGQVKNIGVILRSGTVTCRDDNVRTASIHSDDSLEQYFGKCSM
jgi:threonine dehydratase